MNESEIITLVGSNAILFIVIGVFIFKIVTRTYKELEKYKTDEEMPSEMALLPAFKFGLNVQINNVVRAGEREEHLYIKLPFNKKYKIPYTAFQEFIVKNGTLNKKNVQLNFKEEATPGISLSIKNKDLEGLNSLYKQNLNHKTINTKTASDYNYNPANLDAAKAGLRNVVMFLILFFSAIIGITFIANL
jgi:hypothetical protein